MTAKPPDEKNATTTSAETLPVTETAKTPPETAVAKTEAPATATPKETPPKAEAKASPKEVEAGVDGDIPDGDIVKMPRKALDERLARASKSELKSLFEEFGVKDKDELKGRIAKLKEVEAKEEEQRLANLSEVERLKEEKAASDARAAEWENRFKQRVSTEEFTRVQDSNTKLLSEVLDPDVVDVMLPKLGSYLVAKFSDNELKNIEDSVITDWAKEQVKNKPKLGKDYSPAEKVVEKQKLTSTTKESPPPQSKTGEGPKSYAPQKGETPEQRRSINAELKAKGISF